MGGVPNNDIICGLPGHGTRHKSQLQAYSTEPRVTSSRRRRLLVGVFIHADVNRAFIRSVHLYVSVRVLCQHFKTKITALIVTKLGRRLVLYLVI